MDGFDAHLHDSMPAFISCLSSSTTNGGHPLSPRQSHPRMLYARGAIVSEAWLGLATITRVENPAAWNCRELGVSSTEINNPGAGESGAKGGAQRWREIV